MRFRRSRDTVEWTAKVAALGDLPVRAGVPPWVLRDPRVWSHFLQSGYTGDLSESLYFSISHLADSQVRCLVDIILQLGATSDDVLMCLYSHPLRETIRRELVSRGLPPQRH